MGLISGSKLDLARHGKTYEWKAWLIARLLRLLVGMLFYTWKIKWAGGEERYKAAFAARDPLILCTWHNRLIFWTSFFQKFGIQRGWKMGVMISRSRDGTIGIKMGEMAGARVVEGSSGTGGREAALTFFRMLSKDRHSLLMMIDGSRGPRYIAKEGPVQMAKLTGCPVVPLMSVGEREWLLTNAWDRFRIPKPFTTVTIHWGDPIVVDRRASEAEVEAKRVELEEALNRLRRELDAGRYPEEDEDTLS